MTQRSDFYILSLDAFHGLKVILVEKEFSHFVVDVPNVGNQSVDIESDVCGNLGGGSVLCSTVSKESHKMLSLAPSA